MQPTTIRLVAQYFNELRYMTLSVCVSQRDCCIVSVLYHFKVRMLPLHDTQLCFVAGVSYLSKRSCRGLPIRLCYHCSCWLARFISNNVT